MQQSSCTASVSLLERVLLQLLCGPTLTRPRRSPRQSDRVSERKRQGYRAMPYFKTSTEWFEQSSLLLKARPSSVRPNSSSANPTSSDRTHRLVSHLSTRSSHPLPPRSSSARSTPPNKQPSLRQQPAPLLHSQLRNLTSRPRPSPSRHTMPSRAHACSMRQLRLPKWAV
jgi:hypothetical protein